MPSTIKIVRRAVGGTVKQSREAILTTAVKHFVEKGYDGARIDEIVSDTDTSKKLLYHYFLARRICSLLSLNVYTQNSASSEGRLGGTRNLRLKACAS